EPLCQGPGRRRGGTGGGRRGGGPGPGGAVRPPRGPPGRRAFGRRPLRGDLGGRVDPALTAPRPTGGAGPARGGRAGGDALDRARRRGEGPGGASGPAPVRPRPLRPPGAGPAPPAAPAAAGPSGATRGS